MGPGPRVPFQRTISMDGKPPGAPGGAGRRPMLIKQENMMGSPDGYPGNIGVFKWPNFYFLCTFSFFFSSHFITGCVCPPV